MEFIYPNELNEGTNESSLAMRLTYGEFAAQFVGDLGFEQEAELLAVQRPSGWICCVGKTDQWCEPIIPDQ